MDILDYDINQFYSILLEKFKSGEPFFLARFGGSDYYIIVTELYKTNDKNLIENYINHVSNFNGYYDKETDSEKRIENFKKYCEILESIYYRQKIYTYCGKPTIQAIKKLINNKTSNPLYDKFSSYIVSNNIPVSNYTFIESVYPFLNLFKEIEENKKILIISPFSESVKEQYKNKNNLIKNYTFPNFELITYNTPITYNDTKDLSHIDDSCGNNWIEQSIKMCNDISEINFDIALISAGSYTMYLGNYISSNMGKQSVYLGGVLNVIFNIYGKRYDTSFFNNIMNLDAQVKSNIDINKISGGKSCNNESLLAYF